MRLIAIPVLMPALLAGASVTQTWNAPSDAFELNPGQSGSQARFLLRGPRPAYVTRHSLQFSRLGTGMQFAGAIDGTSARGLDLLPGVRNILRGGDPSRWMYSIPRYAAVESSELYPGIDVIWRIQSRQLSFRLMIRPGADLGDVRVKFTGPGPVRLWRLGAGIVRAGFSCMSCDIALEMPLATQQAGASVPVDFVIIADDEIGFRAGSYDTSQSLMVDVKVEAKSDFPARTWTVEDVAVDPRGNLYMTGPETEPEGAACIVFASFIQIPCNDAYVAKYSPEGELLWVTSIGGSGEERPQFLRSDRAGNVYLAGITESSDFPVTPSAPQRQYGGPRLAPNNSYTPRGGDVFMSVLAAAGALSASTYFGGAFEDYLSHFAVDSSGNAYAAGFLQWGPVPTTPGAIQFPYRSGYPLGGYIVKWSPAASSFVYSAQVDATPTTLAVDATGNVVFTPAALGGDICLSRLNPSGTALVSGPRLPVPGGQPTGHSMALDPSGNAWIMVSLSSPLLPGKQAVVKVDAAGSRILFSELLPGEPNERDRLLVDRAGNILVVLSYFRIDRFTNAEAPLLTDCRSVSGFYVRKLGPGGELRFATYLGSEPLTLDDAGNVYTRNRDLAAAEAADTVDRLDLSAPPELRLDCVVSAASRVPGPLVPGQLVTLLGVHVAPRDSSDGLVVLVGERNAPVVSLRLDAITIQVPYGIASSRSATVQVEFAGWRARSGPLAVTPASFSLFSRDGTGTGQAAALNQDGTLNSAANPAPLGSVIALFGTGAGQTEPPSEEGSIAVHAGRPPVLPVTVYGFPVALELVYVGAAPGQISGVTQVNVRLPLDWPQGVPRGAFPIGVYVGATSQDWFPPWPRVSVVVQ